MTVPINSIFWNSALCISLLHFNTFNQKNLENAGEEFSVEGSMTREDMVELGQ